MYNAQDLSTNPQLFNSGYKIVLFGPIEYDPDELSSIENSIREEFMNHFDRIDTVLFTMPFLPKRRIEYQDLIGLLRPFQAMLAVRTPSEYNALGLDGSTGTDYVNVGIRAHRAMKFLGRPSVLFDTLYHVEPSRLIPAVSQEKPRLEKKDPIIAAGDSLKPAKA